MAFGVDQLSKWLVMYPFDLLSRHHVEIIPGFINFSMGWNTGINFGLLANYSDAMRWVLIGVALVLCVVLWIWVRHSAKWIVHVAAGLTIGGALGNVLDRLVYGAVADFLNVTCCGINNPFVFNIADIFVFAGIIGLYVFATETQKSQA